MATRPEDYARWANISVTDPVTNVPNVVKPTAEKKNIGFRPFESPFRSFINWLFKVNYDWQVYFDERLSQDVVTDGNGSQVVNQQDVIVEIFAVDITTPANYISAKGYKEDGEATVLNVISSNTLTVDSTNADGSIVLSGATASNVKMRVVMSKQINQA